MNKFLIFLILLVPIVPIIGQNSNTIDIKRTSSVISTTGINLRDSPGLDSKILTKLSFGSEINIIENNYYGIDTIGKSIVYYDNRKTEQLIIGNWVKVKYGNYEGFLFDPYLSLKADIKRIKNIDSELELNKDYILLFPGDNCVNNFWSIENLNLIGCYKHGDGFNLKKVKLSYYVGWADTTTSDNKSDYGRANNIWTQDNKDLLFILGSKKNIKEGKVSGKYNLSAANNFDEFDKLEIVGDFESSKLVLNNSSKKQILHFSKDNSFYPSYVVWEGDLDLDGKLDYIIHYGEKSSRTYLYLSSEANNEEIVKPVAVFISGYCC